jgi:hypothetical protein
MGMTKAYLQNKAGEYFTVSDGIINLIKEKSSLKEIPEEMVSIDEINSPHRVHFKSKQTGLIFRKDGLHILTNIFYTQGPEGDCILTLEGDKNMCGDLDFSTFHHQVGTCVKISCVHF